MKTLILLCILAVRVIPLQAQDAAEEKLKRLESEVEELKWALDQVRKSVEYRIYKDAPGGHSYDRIDTTFARDARREMYAFLGKHLK